MQPCSCGKQVRLTATRIRINNKRGVTHAIVHMDGTRVCGGLVWASSMMKPYPKLDSDKPHIRMVKIWELEHA